MAKSVPIQTQLTWRLGSPDAARRVLQSRDAAKAHQADAVATIASTAALSPGGWYLFRCNPARAVQLRLSEEVETMGLQSYCPVRYDWNFQNKFGAAKGDKRKIRYPLFAGYLYIRLPVNALGLFFQVKPRGIGQVIGKDGVPALISNAAMKRLTDQFGGVEHVQPEHWRYMKTHNEFDIGDSVEIDTGPLAGAHAGHSAKVVDLQGKRAFIELEANGQVFTIELPVLSLSKKRD